MTPEKKQNARLIALRGNKSQSEFAAELGLKQRVYSNYENGQELKSGLIRRICEVCGCTSDWLLGFDDIKSNGLSAQESMLLGDFRQCSPEDRLAVMRMARNAAELRKSTDGEAEEARMEGSEGRAMSA